MEIRLKKNSLNKWLVEDGSKKRATVIVYLDDQLVEMVKEDQSLVQLLQAAELPGVLSPVVGMPDIHEGFGLPIGGVMAAENLVSAGAVGMDINCGVRLLVSLLQYKPEQFNQEFLRQLIREIEQVVPIGLGSRHQQGLAVNLEKIIVEGVPFLISQGLGERGEEKMIEEEGCFAGARLETLSDRALKRARNELGTLGSGNHFIEIQVVEKIFNQSLAEKWGIFENQICLMIHTGSRALGHQTCIDYSNRFFNQQAKFGIHVPNKNLAAVPVDSPLGQDYLSAMAGAINFAFANRQLITYFVRQVLKKHFGKEGELRLIYDVAHNIAKWETHQGKKVLVHRKGATRALPAGHSQNPLVYRETGHPAIVPGSMGTASFVMRGLAAGKETYFSINHGAGRRMSRGEATRTIKQDEFEAKMSGIVYNKPFRMLVDEAPQAYKDIDLVIETLVEAGISEKVCRLKPLAVVKGT